MRSLDRESAVADDDRCKTGVKSLRPQRPAINHDASECSCYSSAEPFGAPSADAINVF